MSDPGSRPPSDNTFYYFVLNLNKGASAAEINERHRSLSLIFHPDKQRDDKSREVATKKFLEIQKAYQVLSDPFLRQVYDTLGEQALLISWSPEIRSKSPEDVKRILIETREDMIYKDFEAKIQPSTNTICTIDAASLFDNYDGSPGASLSEALYHRVRNVRVLSLGTKYTVKKKVNDRSTAGLKVRLERLPPGFEALLMGTLRHQFSPRFAAEVDLGLLWPHAFRVSGTYKENGGTINVNASSMLGAIGETSRLNISVSQRLFRRRFETASLELAVGGRPHFGISLISPSVFGTHSLEQSGDSVHSAAPSISGLEVGTTHKKIGISFDSILPTLAAEWGISFAELALQLKLGLQLGLVGLTWICVGTWSNERSSISLATALNLMGVSLRLDLDYLHQQITVPVVLSVEPQIDLALWTTILPFTALVVGHHFIIKPRRHKRRLEHIRIARKALEEDQRHQNERQAIISLLKDSARKSRAAEISKGGLTIAAATYGVHAKENGASDLLIDVTVPLQALVRNSQLYISADHPKWGVQGFSDPAPSARKTLSVRYTFAGLAHYAEIPDDMPVVLPLAEHLVE